jgi:hypothetical protein
VLSRTSEVIDSVLHKDLPRLLNYNTVNIFGFILLVLLHRLVLIGDSGETEVPLFIISPDCTRSLTNA